MSCADGLCFLVYFVLLIIGELEGAVTYPPSNAVAEVNGEAVFNCSATPSGPTLWVLTRDGVISGEIRIASLCTLNAGQQSHYRVEQPGGPTTCNLIVFNITMEQAGVYHCTDTDVFRAVLTVLDASPAVTYSNTLDVKEGEKVVITCTLNYNGSVSLASTLRPHFYWTNYTGSNVSSFNDSTPVNSKAYSQLAVTAQRQDIMPYTCHVYMKLIETGTTTDKYANNTPSINSFASSQTISVQYAPLISVINSKPESITLNGVPCGISVLTCSSSGNPIANITWYDSAKNFLSITETLTLAEINMTYRCEASNNIGTTYKDYTVSNDSCFTNVRCCVFPRNDTTTVNNNGCIDGTAQCDCSQGDSVITLMCNATTYPNALYMWTGPGVTVGPNDSPVYNTVTANGTYRCTAYFDRKSSNYTGDFRFSNGTSDAAVHECFSEASTTRSMVGLSTSAATSTTKHEQITITAFECTSVSANAAAIALGVLLFISLVLNIIVMVILIWNRRAKRDPFKRTGIILQPEMLDLSPETQTPTTYEELSRPTENNLQLSTYEELRHRPTIDSN